MSFSESKQTVRGVWGGKRIEIQQFPIDFLNGYWNVTVQNHLVKIIDKFSSVNHWRSAHELLKMLVKSAGDFVQSREVLAQSVSMYQSARQTFSDALPLC